MLVLTRRVGEVIRIGEDIQIAFIGMRGKQSKVAIQAPASLSVHREEIYQKIKQEKKGEVGESASQF